MRADPVQGVVRLGLPARGGAAAAAQLLADHQGWLCNQVARWPAPLPFVPGAAIPFDGGTLHLEWAPNNARTPRREGDLLFVGGPQSMLAGRALRWLKAAALAELTDATHRYAAMVARPVAQVRVADPRARWGSCATTAGRIAYSWRLILAPPMVRNNVVAHEVAHLVHPNHGPQFHALLRQLDPNERAARAWLKAHGAGLHWVGREEPGPQAPDPGR
nr:SprT family zinc-dependent metalloprotease [Polymorphobacter fuscus]